MTAVSLVRLLRQNHEVVPFSKGPYVVMRLIVTASLLAAPALAGDAAVGEADFKTCKACHSIIASDGTEVVKGGKIGPNLWGVMSRQIGSYPDFKYGKSIVAAGAAASM